MNLNQLKYFISVASCRSFTQAAELNFMTQTAITQQIKALEDQLDLKLIDRRKRPIELTASGEVFYREAKAILGRVEDAVLKSREASTGASGKIRIGYEKGYERTDLSDRLRDFHREFPNILFTCIRADTDTLSEKLMRDELDIIFAWDSTNLRINEDIAYVRDMRARLYAALYLSHPLAVRKSLKREDLKEETLIYLTPSSTGESSEDILFLKLYEKAGYQPKILLRSNDMESVLMMVAAEQGISVLPDYGVAKLSNAENLLFLPMEGEEEYEDIFIMWKKSNDNSALESFRSFLVKPLGQ